MLYKTHKVGGSVAMLLGFNYLQANGLLVEGINPLLQLAVMYPYASWGSTAPDLDHHDTSIKEQTPVNLMINKVLKLFGVNHRGITHSVIHVLLPSLVLLGFADIILTKLAVGISFELVFLRLMVFGALLGVISHLVLDAMTVSGIPINPRVKKSGRLRLVPKRSFFKVGETWESIVMRVLYLLLVLLVLNIFSMMYFDLNIFKFIVVIIETVRAVG